MDANLPNPEYALRDDARKSKEPSVTWAANHQKTVLSMASVGVCYLGIVSMQDFIAMGIGRH